MRHDWDDATKAQTWLRNARGDLALAQIELPRDATYELLSFHAQQAAEKSIKALLICLGVDFPFTHNIQLLVSLLPQEFQMNQVFTDAATLSPYAVLTRYPIELPPLTQEKYEEAVQIAAAVVGWVEDYISQPD